MSSDGAARDAGPELAPFRLDTIVGFWFKRGEMTSKHVEVDLAPVRPGGHVEWAHCWTDERHRIRMFEFDVDFEASCPPRCTVRGDGSRTRLTASDTIFEFAANQLTFWYPGKTSDAAVERWVEFGWERYCQERAWEGLDARGCLVALRFEFNFDDSSG